MELVARLGRVAALGEKRVVEELSRLLAGLPRGERETLNTLLRKLLQSISS